MPIERFLPRVAVESTALVHRPDSSLWYREFLVRWGMARIAPAIRLDPETEATLSVGSKLRPPRRRWYYGVGSS